jgi:hypothetical protein
MVYALEAVAKGLPGSITVNIQNPDRLVFERSFFGHFLSPRFKLNALAAILLLKIGQIVRSSNALD